MNASQHPVDTLPPSYAEATWRSCPGKRGSYRLPPYRYYRSARYHPYPRSKRDALEGEDLLSTIFEDSRVILNVPPALAGTRHPAMPLDIQALMNEQLDRALALDRRVHRLVAQNVMIGFIVGVRQAIRR
ncbi:hypothetical protein NLJ89_g9738 [Agrocybe chaxingu]|uniref:Uncharacterized protein n=1 Tax=Agrocybe chaxingu TaxID=84603 RepID=A0A9W8JSX4_9AGAR|nr:hypothetical protein NLJ89_g9738 [Agrocybe chaxingu]